MSIHTMPSPRPLDRVCLCVPAALVSGLLLSPPVRAAAAQPLQLVHVSEGRLTVAAHDAGLRALVEEVARAIDLRVEGADVLHGDVTVRFRRQTLEAGLAQILRGWQYTIGSEVIATPGSPESTVTRLRIVGAPSGSARAPDAPEAPDAPVGLPPVHAAATGSGSGPVDQLLTSADPSTARRAGLAALRDPDREVRAAAVGMLGARGGEHAVTLLELALRDSELGIRFAAVDALGLIGGPRAARGVTAAIHDRSRGLRLRAVEVLGRIGGATALQLLEYVQAVDRDDAVRSSAAARVSELRAGH